VTEINDNIHLILTQQTGHAGYLATQPESNYTNRHSYTTTRLRPDFDRIIARATAPNAAPTLLFTIFLGANDACFIGEDRFMVPWPMFEENMRFFIDTILSQDAMSRTKIVLIGPPPINGLENKLGDGQTEDDVEEINRKMKEGRRYKMYMSKKRYADGMMEIAKRYEETGRVIGLSFWRGVVEQKMKDDGGRWEDVERSGMWPGCGLIGAKSFEDGWFTDGLHLDTKGYGALNRMLMEEVLGKWPELAVERL
jgi:lysophospholipase L1-like esterase